MLFQHVRNAFALSLSLSLSLSISFFFSFSLSLSLSLSLFFHFLSLSLSLSSDLFLSFSPRRSNDERRRVQVLCGGFPRAPHLPVRLPWQPAHHPRPQPPRGQVEAVPRARPLRTSKL
jgi:hypothetical protein